MLPETKMEHTAAVYVLTWPGNMYQHSFCCLTHCVQSGMFYNVLSTRAASKK